MRDLNTIQEKILDRALFLIGEKGSYDVPIRDITREAGVNINAINYYFNNKENMIDQMEEFFIKNYISAYSVLDEDMGDEEKLLAWANEIMEYTLQYPGIRILLRDNLRLERNGKMKRFLLERDSFYNQKVDQLIRNVFGVDDKSLHLIRILFDSAILNPVTFGTNTRFDLTEIKKKEFRLHYLSFVINTLKRGVICREI